MANGSEIGVMMRILHEVTEMGRSPFSQPPISPGDRIADVSFEAVRDKSKKAADLLARLEALDLGQVPAELALTLRIARFDLRRMAKAADWYWLVFDPSGHGFYAMFAATSYCGGFLVSQFVSFLKGFSFERGSDRDRYLAHLSDMARIVDQLAARTAGQAERGIYMPKKQLEQASTLLPGLCRMLVAATAVPDAKLGPLPSFDAEIRRRAVEDIEPAFARLEAMLADPVYRARATDAVGLTQYPGGAQIYAELVKIHTTMDMTPEEVHRAGLERMKTVRSGMADIRAEIGFGGSDKDYLKLLEDDPAWRAATSEGIGAVFQRYIDRLKPQFAELFDFESPNPYGAAPLAPALEASMTFGYYDMPRPDKPRGEYMFNTANLSQNALFNIGALNYHELVPGHHLHLSVQLSNDRVHPLHNTAFFSAFNEGWAEYAATLAGERGMYAEPAERFGRLVMDAFLTCRLVVDTGMNAFGWGLEQARDYMRENAFMPETEIRSESLRYSCDIPGQSLAYKLGDTEMLRLREKMRERLGNRFDIKDFHRAVLHPGGMPLPELEWHIDRTIERLAENPEG